MTRNARIKVTALLAATGATGIALGDFSELNGQETLRYYAADGSTITDFDNAAYAVLDLYVKFDADNTHDYSNSESHMLALFDGNLVANNFTMFNQSDLTGSGNTGDGSWKPTFSFDIPGTANPTIDSFVTIGGGVGALAATNVTTPDPNLGKATALDIFNENVGWFLNPPTSAQGDVDSNLEVWVGRFVVTGDDARAGANFDLSISIGYNYGEATGAYFGDAGDNFTFVPAPAALALLGLGGVSMRRRRA